MIIHCIWMFHNSIKFLLSNHPWSLIVCDHGFTTLRYKQLMCFTNPAAWSKLSRIIGIISYCYPVIADTWLNFKEVKQENTRTMQNHKMNTCINHSYSYIHELVQCAFVVDLLLFDSQCYSLIILVQGIDLAQHFASTLSMRIWK